MLADASVLIMIRESRFGLLQESTPSVPCVVEGSPALPVVQGKRRALQNRCRERVFRQLIERVLSHSTQARLLEVGVQKGGRGDRLRASLRGLSYCDDGDGSTRRRAQQSKGKSGCRGRVHWGSQWLISRQMTCRPWEQRLGGWPN